MFQIYWQGWQNRKWGFSRGGFNDQGVKLKWTLNCGVLQFSAWRIKRFDVSESAQPSVYARPWRV